MLWDNLFHHHEDDEEQKDDDGDDILLQELKETKQKKQMAPSLWVRGLIVLLLFVMVFGPQLGYASFGSISTQLKEDMGLTDAQFGFLFAIFSLPNIVAVLIAGMCR